MVALNEMRLRLCDPNKQRLSLIKDLLRKKVHRPWYTLTKKELNRIRRPFESYDKELLEEGYTQSSKHLRRLLSVKNESGGRDTALIDDKDLLHHAMNCFKYLESCERDKCSTTVAIDNLVHIAHKMTTISVGIACEFYELILDKMKASDYSELSKTELQLSFGTYLVNIKHYEKANGILKDALNYSEENKICDLTRRICKVYYDSLYNLCLKLRSINKALAIQLADTSKDIALKMKDIKATTMSYLQRGSILMSMEEYEKAIIDLQSATAELKKMPDLNLKVEIMYKLSTCYFTIKDYDACLLTLGALGRIATIYNKIEYQAHFGLIDGNVKLLMGENLMARKKFLKSIEIYDDIGLSEYATSCRFLEAIAKCEHLMNPWINVLIEAEKEQSSDDRFKLNEWKNLMFNWKLKRELFIEMEDQ